MFIYIQILLHTDMLFKAHKSKFNKVQHQIHVIKIVTLFFQIFEWWYFKKYGTSFIEQVSLNHISPLLGGTDGQQNDNNNTNTNSNNITNTTQNQQTDRKSVV